MTSASYDLFLAIAAENADFLDVVLDEFDPVAIVPTTPGQPDDQLAQEQQLARLERRAEFLDIALDDLNKEKTGGQPASSRLRTPSRSPRRAPRLATGDPRRSATQWSSMRPGKVGQPTAIEIADDDDELVDINLTSEGIDLSIIGDTECADTEASEEEVTEATLAKPTLPAEDADIDDIGLHKEFIHEGGATPPWRRAQYKLLSPPPSTARPSQAPSLSFPLGCVSGRRDHVPAYEQVLLRAEFAVAKAYGIPWADRGPPAPPPGPNRFWRGQAHREGSEGGKARWANRGGKHKDYYAALARQNLLPKTLGGDSISSTQRFASRLNVVFNQRLKLRTVQKHVCANS
jgi:hypothetical protein